MRLVVGFGWVDIVLGQGFVVRRMMTKLVGVDQSNTLTHTQIVALLLT